MSKVTLLDIENAIKTYTDQIINDVEYSLNIPVAWAPEGDGQGGPPPADPLLFHISTRFGESDPELAATVSLRGAVKSYLADGAEDGRFEAGLRLFAQALRRLANEIDETYDARNRDK